MSNQTVPMRGIDAATQAAWRERRAAEEAAFQAFLREQWRDMNVDAAAAHAVELACCALSDRNVRL